MLHAGREALLGRPLGDLLAHGAEELENALQYVLAEGAPTGRHRPVGHARAATADGRALLLAQRLRTARVAAGGGAGAAGRGLAVLRRHRVQKTADQESARIRFRYQQLHRADRAAAECESAPGGGCPATGLRARRIRRPRAGGPHRPRPGGWCGSWPPPRASRARAVPPRQRRPGRLRRRPPRPPGRRTAGHRTHQLRRRRTPRPSGQRPRARTDEWAEARHWPPGTVHGLATVLRSRGRTVGALTFLRGAGRRLFDRADAAYAEDVAARVAMALDLAGLTGELSARDHGPEHH